MRKRDIPEHLLRYFKPRTVYKPKNLLMMPHRCALALQAWGWIVRSTLVWHKLNPMPESCQDRPTTAHEYVFMLTKAPRYYYDADAVREPAEYGRRDWNGQTPHAIYDAAGEGQRLGYATTGGDPSAGRNMRSVLHIATEPFSQAHFATFSTKLVEPLLRASMSEAGACPACSAPWRRVTEQGELVPDAPGYKPRGHTAPDGYVNVGMTLRGEGQPAPNHHYERIDRGWKPSCTCENPGPPRPCVCLDPFAGSGTVGVVASRLGHRALLIDQNPDYLQMARDRIAKEPTRLFAVTESVKKPKPAPKAPAAPRDAEGRYRCEGTLTLPETSP